MTDVHGQIAALVKAESGLVGSSEAALTSALARIAPGLELTAFPEAARQGDEGRALLLRLIDELTINETYFCRERGQLDAIPWRALRDAAVARGSGCVRVWSAACSSGEEAYTLALSAWESLGPASPPVEIVATDIAPSMVVRARGGRYGRRSVRELDDSARDRWFVRIGEEWEVTPELRRLVTFGVHNLTHDAAPLGDEQKFDLILCRNVLIYFDDELSRDVVTRLRGALHPGGMLVLGSADALGETSRALDAITKRQGARQAPAAGRRRPEPRAEAPAGQPTADADACFALGVEQLEKGRGDEAVRWFRQALWLDDSFVLAVFALGRAYDLIGDDEAAARAYRRALRTVGAEGQAARPELDGVALDDVVAAGRARLSALEAIR